MLRTPLAALLSLALAGAVYATTLEGHVVRVADGDTITIQTNSSNEKLRIRLRGIDAPEKAQTHGEEAKRALTWLLAGTDVVVDYDEKDRYGRIVGQVAVGNVDAGLFMLEGGHAWVYRNYVKKLPYDWQRAYFTAEKQAKANRKGLWSEANPTPPWDYRKATKGQVTRENLSNDVAEIHEKMNGWADKFAAWLKKLMAGTLLGDN